MSAVTQIRNEIKKTIVITGGSSGIGLETAKILTQEPGTKLVLIGRDIDRLKEAESVLGPEKAVSYSCDLSDSKQIHATLDKIIDTQKNLYGLINNAGVYPFGGLQTTSEEEWDRTFNINLKSAFLFSQKLAPYLAKHSSGGRILNISSTAGILPNHFALAYSVSKAALIQLTKTLAKELGKDQITVNCICPGVVRTPLHESYHVNHRELEEFYSRRGAAFPMGRVGESQDIAQAVEFLLSEKSAWTTGHVMVIDGGRLLL